MTTCCHNQLTGPIAPQQGQLAHLWELRVAGNRLSGEFPAELGYIPYLGELHIAGNRLTGSIPAELAEVCDVGEWGGAVSAANSLAEPGPTGT